MNTNTFVVLCILDIILSVYLRVKKLNIKVRTLETFKYKGKLRSSLIVFTPIPLNICL